MKRAEHADGVRMIVTVLIALVTLAVVLTVTVQIALTARQSVAPPALAQVPPGFSRPLPLGLVSCPQVGPVVAAPAPAGGPASCAGRRSA